MVWRTDVTTLLDDDQKDLQIIDPARFPGSVDDPVTYLSADTALQQPDGWPTTWLPGLSYGTTVLEISVDPYGPEEAMVTVMAYCVQGVRLEQDLLLA